MQHCDDDGRDLRAIYLGPKGTFRMPVDMSYSQWGIFLLCMMALTLLFISVIPVVAVPLASAWIASAIYREYFPESSAFLIWTVRLSVLILPVNMYPNLGFWLFPPDIFVAIALSLAPAFYIAWKFGKSVTRSFPLAYWLILPGRIANRPGTETRKAMIALNGIAFDSSGEFRAIKVKGPRRELESKTDDRTQDK